ncbi:hypothetical protein MN2019_24525 [Mycolicibacterium neoaurum]|uniref:hypothetical protein n=1 Tax=Mycolicibacterium neoaurum TaxID=1795 RepID=UPI001BCC4B0E|nr:hypothetical protein [Mycolicibacterium neoaurum]QVI27329.1 hypothetical protein MN2019_24525 [Mycolicibacterium neoaurum]
MDRSDEMRFAWALADAARPFINPGAHTWLCVKIGAGEYRNAILELLERFVARDAEFPLALAPSLWAWVSGFAGCSTEERLRALGMGLRLGPKIPEPVPPPPPPPPPLVARRPYAAMKTRATRLRLISMQARST